MNQHSFTQSVDLTESNRVRLTSLFNRCNHFESLSIPIFLDHLKSDSDATTAVTCLNGDSVVGFAAIPDDPYPESCLMVDPAHRRQGIGRQLIEVIRTEIARRRLPDTLLLTDQASKSGRAFLAALAIPYEVSEYLLEYKRGVFDQTRSKHDGLTLRLATDRDAEVMTRIRVAAFGGSETAAANHIKDGLQEKSRHFYIAELQGRSVGMLRAGEWDGQGDITAFAVLPEYQGRGLGRQILIEAIERLIGQGLPGIFIEVETQNHNALHLYESCGFKVINEFGYYRLNAAN